MTSGHLGNYTTLTDVTRVLTDRAIGTPVVRETMARGKEFTGRLFGLRRRAATGNHEFDRIRADLGIEHHLAPPMRPQTNGMVERFNGRIEDILQSHRFRSGEDLEQTILRYVHLYNSTKASYRGPSSRAEHPSMRSKAGIVKDRNCSESSRIIKRDVTEMGSQKVS